MFRVGVGARFGRLHVHPAAPSVPGHPEVMIIHADANSKFVNGEAWHSDVSCEEEPPMGSVLYMRVLPEVGGDTLFANMYAAYDALSEPMRRMLSDAAAYSLPSSRLRHSPGPNGARSVDRWSRRRLAARAGREDRRRVRSSRR